MSRDRLAEGPWVLSVNCRVEEGETERAWAGRVEDVSDELRERLSRASVGWGSVWLFGGGVWCFWNSWILLVLVLFLVLMGCGCGCGFGFACLVIGLICVG